MFSGVASVYVLGPIGLSTPSPGSPARCSTSGSCDARSAPPAIPTLPRNSLRVSAPGAPRPPAGCRLRVLRPGDAEIGPFDDRGDREQREGEPAQERDLAAVSPS